MRPGLSSFTGRLINEIELATLAKWANREFSRRLIRLCDLYISDLALASLLEDICPCRLH